MKIIIGTSDGMTLVSGVIDQYNYHNQNDCVKYTLNEYATIPHITVEKTSKDAFDTIAGFCHLKKFPGKDAWIFA